VTIAFGGCKRHISENQKLARVLSHEIHEVTEKVKGDDRVKRVEEMVAERSKGGGVWMEGKKGDGTMGGD
jgi:hypothetical protein